MAARKRDDGPPGSGRGERDQHRRTAGTAVHAAIDRGFVIGREVLIGAVPGIVVGYNIGSFGQFIGNAYPLVVRTALGVTKCGTDEVSLL